MSRNERGRFGALKSDSTHHFFRNACTKSGHYGFHSFPVVNWFCLFIYLWVFTFPLLDCSEFGNFVITLIYEVIIMRHLGFWRYIDIAIIVKFIYFKFRDIDTRVYFASIDWVKVLIWYLRWSVHVRSWLVLCRFRIDRDLSHRLRSMADIMWQKVSDIFNIRIYSYRYKLFLQSTLLSLCAQDQ